MLPGGIGKAIVNEFLELGAEVFIVSRNEKDIDELIEVCKSKGYKALGMNECRLLIKTGRRSFKS